YHQAPAVPNVLRDHFEAADVKTQPERVAQSAHDARGEAGARGDSGPAARQPLPLVRDVGAPLPAPVTASSPRCQPAARIDQGEEELQHFRLPTSHFKLQTSRPAIAQARRI